MHQKSEYRKVGSDQDTAWDRPRNSPFPTRKGGGNTQGRMSVGRVRQSHGPAPERRASLPLIAQAFPKAETVGSSPCPNERRERPAMACSREIGMLATTAEERTYVLTEESSDWGSMTLSLSPFLHWNKNHTISLLCLTVHYQRSVAPKLKFESDFPRRGDPKFSVPALLRFFLHTSKNGGPERSDARSLPAMCTFEAPSGRGGVHSFGHAVSSGSSASGGCKTSSSGRLLT